MHHRQKSLLIANLDGLRFSSYFQARRFKALIAMAIVVVFASSLGSCSGSHKWPSIDHIRSHTADEAIQSTAGLRSFLATYYCRGSYGEVSFRGPMELRASAAEFLHHSGLSLQPAHNSDFLLVVQTRAIDPEPYHFVYEVSGGLKRIRIPTSKRERGILAEVQFLKLGQNHRADPLFVASGRANFVPHQQKGRDPGWHEIVANQTQATEIAFNRALKRIGEEAAYFADSACIENEPSANPTQDLTTTDHQRQLNRIVENWTRSE